MVISHFSCGGIHLKGRDFRLFDAVALGASHSNYLIASAVRTLIGTRSLHRVKPGVAHGIGISVVARITFIVV